jgi:hypothetical protein
MAKFSWIKVFWILRVDSPEKCQDSFFNYLQISQQRFFSLILSVTLQWHKKLQTPPEMTVELDEAVVNLLCQLLVSPKEDFRAWSAENCRLAGTVRFLIFTFLIPKTIAFVITC